MAYKGGWKCYACGFEGPEAEFNSPQGHRCPRETCTSPENCFPHRKYECLECGAVKSQLDWFGEETLLDAEALSEGETPKPCEDCLKKLEDKIDQVRLTGSGDIAGLYARLDELESRPANLELIEAGNLPG